MKKTIGIMITTALVGACTVPPPQDVQHPAHGLGVAVGYLVASPILILAGIAEGISATPYFLETDLHAMNTTMKKSHAAVDLERTYQYAYQAPLAAVPADGNTGQVFRHLMPATEHFQSVLRGYGVDNPEHYVVTAVRTADKQGYTLYALVYRPDGRITVKDARGQIASLTPRDDAFYRPYARDAEGRPLDSIIDWAAVPRTTIRTQKGQAILMTLAANSVLINRRSDDFWDTAERWRAGAFKAIAEARKAALDRRMS